MEFISAENVSFYYDTDDEQQNSVRQYALNGVDLEIKKGEFVALLGHNGCGKSTMAKQLNAMLTPVDGDIFVDSVNTKDDKKTFDIRRKVGLVLQNPDNQLVASVVEEDVAFGPENLGIEPKEIRRRVDKALIDVDMSEYSKHSPSKLSGGQKQRVAIAGIIAMEPDCIVLDEPTAMLDPKGRQEVLDAVIKLNKENKITIVLITHYMDEAVLADRVVVMDKGKILTQGTPQEVFSQVQLLKKHRLDVPQGTELAYKLKCSGANIDKMPLTDGECIEMLEGILG